MSIHPVQNEPRSAMPVRRLEPMPADPLGKRLCEIFSYRWQAILATAPDDARQKPVWQTLTKYPLRPRSLWNLWQDAGQLVGVRFGHTTSYALLDIDAQSSYHPSRNAESLPRLRLALETIGLYRSIVVRSSWSGGLHLYVPLPEAIATFDLAVALRRCLEAQGFGVCQGQLEVFPNVKRYGRDGQFVEYNGHRLPLQPASGSVLLSDDLQPVPGGLVRFFDAWEIACRGQDGDELRQAIATARKHHRRRTVSRSNQVESWQHDLLTEIETGWTGHGQTNHLLKTIACYAVVFQGLSGVALENEVLRVALSRPGYQEWCRHQHDISQRSQVWAAAAAAYYWPLGSTPKRRGDVHTGQNNAVSFNRRRAEDAQQRIQQAIATLTEQGTLPTGLTARRKAIAELAKCSFSTLQKYKSLWYDSEPVTHSAQDVEALSPEDACPSPQSLDPFIDEALHTNPLMKGCREMASGFTSFSSQGEGQGRGNDGFPQGENGLSRCFSEPDAIDGDASGGSLYDFSDVIASIQVCIRQLRWDAAQTQDFIAQHFHGKRRSQLSDDDLLHLLALLRVKRLSLCE